MSPSQYNCHDSSGQLPTGSVVFPRVPLGWILALTLCKQSLLHNRYASILLKLPPPCPHDSVASGEYLRGCAIPWASYLAFPAPTPRSCNCSILFFLLRIYTWQYYYRSFLPTLQYSHAFYSATGQLSTDSASGCDISAM